MSEAFADYARAYDLLYQDKDYQSEATFIGKLLLEHAPAATSVLELGCGTGIHAALLAGQGYQVHGVDLSTVMLDGAEERRRSLPAVQAERLAFTVGDLRNVRLEQQYDVVVALFHVLCYQTTDDDLRAAFRTVRHHLKPGGVVIFDYWYGPAVLTERPAVRVKRMENDQIAVTRIAEPTMYPNENVVEVGYTVFVQELATDTTRVIREQHRMRYLFLPEIAVLLADAGLGLIGHGSWLTSQTPDWHTWSVYTLGQG
ncbi:MAG: class I SAM-dependent methyltransferase [Herpetosiphon sp.]